MTPEVVALLADHRTLEIRLATATALLKALPSTALPANTFYVREFKPDPAVVATVSGWVKALQHDAAAPFPNLDPPQPAQAEAA